MAGKIVFSQKKQLSIFLENKPGTLHRVTQAFERENINIEGIMVSEGTDHAVVRMITNDPQKAVHILGEAGMLVIENDVVVVQIPNKPGMLSRIVEKLAESSINIDYAYGTGGDAEIAYIVLKVNDIERFNKIKFDF